MKTKSNRWFVIASRTRARIFEVGDSGKGLDLRDTLENPDGRSRGRELLRHSKGTGQSRGGVGLGRRYTLSSHRDPHELIAVQFAKKIADYLDKQVSKDKVGQLSLVAEPHILGVLKKELSTKVANTLTRSIRKDLDKVDVNQLPKYLGIKPKERLLNAR